MFWSNFKILLLSIYHNVLLPVWVTRLHSKWGELSSAELYVGQVVLGRGELSCTPFSLYGGTLLSFYCRFIIYQLNECKQAKLRKLITLMIINAISMLVCVYYFSIEYQIKWRDWSIIGSSSFCRRGILALWMTFILFRHFFLVLFLTGVYQYSYRTHNYLSTPLSCSMLHCVVCIRRYEAVYR